MATTSKDRMKEAEERFDELKRIREQKIQEIDERSKKRKDEGERVRKHARDILAKYQ